jgi:hypothetical protein
VSVLNKIDRLLPTLIDYDAVRIVPSHTTSDFFFAEDEKTKLQKVDRWANAMMKQQVDDEGKIVGYTFNNTRENVEATFRVLCRLAEFTPPQRDKKPEHEVEIAAEEEAKAA